MRLIEMIWDVIAENRIQSFEQLRCNELIYSKDGICHKIFAHKIDAIQKLSSNQEEADTKLLLHANHALYEDSSKAVILRSPSGDVDINVLFVSV